MRAGRVGLLVIGLILIVVGAVLWYVPVATTSQTVGEKGGTTVLEVQSNALVSQYFTGTWSSSSSSSVLFFAWDCGTTQPDLNNLNAPCPNPTYLTPGGTSYVNGTSGSLSFSVPGGHWLLFSASGPTSVTLKSSYGTLGPILLIVGVLLLIVGAVVQRKPKRSMTTPAGDAAPAPPP